MFSAKDITFVRGKDFATTRPTTPDFDVESYLEDPANLRDVKQWYTNDLLPKEKAKKHMLNLLRVDPGRTSVSIYLSLKLAQGFAQVQGIVWTEAMNKELTRAAKEHLFQYVNFCRSNH